MSIFISKYFSRILMRVNRSLHLITLRCKSPNLNFIHHHNLEYEVSLIKSYNHEIYRQMSCQWVVLWLNHFSSKYKKKDRSYEWWHVMTYRTSSVKFFKSRVGYIWTLTVKVHLHTDMICKSFVKMIDLSH